MLLRGLMEGGFRGWLGVVEVFVLLCCCLVVLCGVELLCVIV